MALLGVRRGARLPENRAPLHRVEDEWRMDHGRRMARQRHKYSDAEAQDSGQSFMTSLLFSQTGKPRRSLTPRC
jgi:hypothetical protein